MKPVRKTFKQYLVGLFVEPASSSEPIKAELPRFSIDNAFGVGLSYVITTTLYRNTGWFGNAAEAFNLPVLVVGALILGFGFETVRYFIAKKS